MSAELYISPKPTDSNGLVQTTTTGGTKPLHRFIKGQPKIVGTIVLIMGTSILTITAMILKDRDMHFIQSVIPLGLLQGILYIICGILYILTEHNPTKKNVTLSLALSIVTLLGTLWTILHIVPMIGHWRDFSHYEEMEDEEHFASLQYERMGNSMGIIFLLKFITGGIIFATMSALGGMALRSGNNKAVVVMTTAQTETTAE